MTSSVTTKPVKKIAVIIPKYGLVGGAEGFAAELTERIALNNRFEMHVLANRWSSRSDRIIFHKIPIIRFPKFLTTISFAYFVRQKLSCLDMDLIHAHDRIFHADLFTMHGIPHRIWVKQIRQKRWLSLFDRGTAWVEGRLIQDRSCRCILPVSALTRDALLEEYPALDPARIQVMHPGVDMAEYLNLDRRQCREEIRRLYGIGESDFLILFVSMNFDVKGLDQLVAALAKLKGNLPAKRTRLLVVGKGDQQRYRKYARDLGVEDSLAFAGVVRRDLLTRIYMAADLYAMLSQFDTFGMVVLEAMAASLPVIISAHVGAKDLVREGVNGYTIQDPADIDGIAGRIMQLQYDETRHALGQAAHETARNHSWDAAAKQMEAIYEKAFPA